MKLADSSCIICLFNEINRPFILLGWIKRGYKIIITSQVHEELVNNQKTHKAVEPIIKRKQIQIMDFVKEDEFESFRARYPYLGKGELSIIQASLKLQSEKKRYYAIIDDGKARKVAQKLGINMTGTFGLLKTLKEKKELSEEEYKKCVALMENSSFRINVGKLQ